MSTSQAIIVFALTVLAVVGGTVGLVAFLGAVRSLCQGELTPIIASDDDLRPHPRLMRPRV